MNTEPVADRLANQRELAIAFKPGPVYVRRLFGTRMDAKPATERLADELELTAGLEPPAAGHARGYCVRVNVKPRAQWLTRASDFTALEQLRDRHLENVTQEPSLGR
jgi:hypothetical protein